MSTVDPAWTAWAEKAAAEYNSRPKPGEEMASEPASQKAWQAKCQHERDRLAKAEYKQMCDQLIAEHTASLAEKARDPAWQAQMDEITRQMKREHRAQNLARRMLQERRLHAFTTDLLIGHLWNARQRSMTSDWESHAQSHYDTVTMKTLLELCDHLGITDPGAAESLIDAPPVSTAQQSGGAA